MTKIRARRGIALVAALALMTLIAILVVGGVASSKLAQRASQLARTDAALTAASDYAINTVLGDAAGYRLGELPFGQSRLLGVPFDDGEGIQIQLSATRLQGGVLWLVAEATLDGVDQGYRRVNVVARFPSLGGDPQAGIVARGDVRLGSGVAFLPDTDRDADCLAPFVADIIVAPGSSVTAAASTRVARQTRATDSTTYDLSSSQLDALRAGAGVTLVAGDTTIGGGSFDGILVVQGNLTIGGPFAVTGLVVARGQITARAGGLTVNGAMLSFAPAGGGAAVDIDGASIRYSRCTIGRVMRTAFPPRPVPQRSWAELF